MTIHKISKLRGAGRQLPPQTPKRQHICVDCHRSFVPAEHNWQGDSGDVPVCNICLDEIPTINRLTQKPMHQTRRPPRATEERR